MNLFNYMRHGRYLLVGPAGSCDLGGFRTSVQLGAQRRGISVRGKQMSRAAATAPVRVVV